MSEKQNGLSRRDFLVSAGTFAASAFASGGVMGAIAPAMAAAPNLPWPYVTLNADSVMQAAYNNYKVGGCMYATGKALVDALAASAGAPWDTINPDMFKFGKGGVNSWGTLCGALNGSLCIIGMVAGSAATSIYNELFGWYGDFCFPSTKMDAYSAYPNQPQTFTKSPLCHNSSTRWATEFGYKISSPERKDRCGKVAGDVAYQVVTYLNAWKAGTFAPVYQAPDYQTDTAFERCFTCHIGTTSTKDNAQGKMNCLIGGCHPEKATHKL